MSVRFIGRANVAKLLAPLEGVAGSTVYDGSIPIPAYLVKTP